MEKIRFRVIFQHVGNNIMVLFKCVGSKIMQGSESLFNKIWNLLFDLENYVTKKEITMPLCAIQHSVINLYS